MTQLERTETGFRHWCPGCNAVHEIATEPTLFGDAPRVVAGSRDTVAGEVTVVRPGSGVCRYRLAAGVIYFRPGCAHKLAGECVPLEPIPDGQ